MDLRRLQYFTVVVETGSLTAAAAQLHLSQPALSVAIRKLEAEVGVELLRRSARGVEATSAGRYLLDASTRLFGELDDITAAMRRFGAGTAGSLAIAAVPVLMWQRIPDLLRRYAHEAPDVAIRLTDPPPWTAIELLQQRAVDVAAVNVFRPDRFIERHGGALSITDWGEIPLVAVFAAGSDLPPREAVPWSVFHGRTVLVPRRTAGVPSLPEAVDHAFALHEVTPAEIRTVETIQTSIPLIEAGLACALLPDPDRRSLARFPISVAALAPEGPTLRALLLTRADGAEEPAVRRLLDLAAAVD
ncbi:LysR family transcriptional regulator [Microbacterium sp. NPDC058021]|uniref:LysR family transcriptional regulator n=1 Tax=Microbacterium sp. NPDC058021 TaxID=3346306 RepID=UPI0036DE62CE